MAISLSDATLRLLDGRNYAVLATVNPDGSPQTSAMWIGRDGSDVLFSTVAGRRKHRNLGSLEAVMSLALCWQIYLD